MGKLDFFDVASQPTYENPNPGDLVVMCVSLNTYSRKSGGGGVNLHLESVQIIKENYKVVVKEEGNQIAAPLAKKPKIF